MVLSVVTALMVLIGGSTVPQSVRPFLPVDDNNETLQRFTTTTTTASRSSISKKVNHHQAHHDGQNANVNTTATTTTASTTATGIMVNYTTTTTFDGFSIHHNRSKQSGSDIVCNAPLIKVRDEKRMEQCVEAVCVICQYKLEMVSPLYDILIEAVVAPKNK